MQKTITRRYREFLLASVILPFGLAAHGSDTTQEQNVDASWLSRSNNPLATTDQIYAENLAKVIVARPEVAQAAEAMGKKWVEQYKSLGGVPAEAQASLPQAVAEAAFSSALWAIDGDPNYPLVVSRMAKAHTWFGLQVPGAFTTENNPDTIYRIVPLDPNASYVVYGHRYKHAPIDANFSVEDSRQDTLSNLSGADIVTDANGDFTLTLDSSPSNGNVNHIQLQSTATLLDIRDTVNLWGIQQFNHLSVKRVGGPTVPARQTFDQIVAATVKWIGTFGTGFGPTLQTFTATPVNTLSGFSGGQGSQGYLSTQATQKALFNLADDEALVLNINLGGAKYFVVPIYTPWTTGTDFVHHTESLDNRQAVANPDGTYTFVISPTDPGVYNWVDTAGIHQGMTMLRWQALPENGGQPSATMQLVNLADLAAALPSTMKYVTFAGRKAQLNARISSYAPRYAEYEPNAFYSIAAESSGLCMDLTGETQANGDNLFQNPCNGSAAEAWSLAAVDSNYDSNYYRLVTKVSGKCLSVAYNSTQQGALLVQESCQKSPDNYEDQWKLVVAASGGYQIVSRLSGQCANVDGNSQDPTTWIIQWPCSGSTDTTVLNDKFRFATSP